MKQLFIITTIIVLGCIFCFNAQAAITAVNNNDAQGLVQQLLSVSGGATTSNEIVTQGVCSGTFSDGLSVDGGTNFLIDEGIILSSGNITGISPPNNSDGGFFDDLGLPGDLFLNSLIGQFHEGVDQLHTSIILASLHVGDGVVASSAPQFQNGRLFGNPLENRRCLQLWKEHIAVGLGNVRLNLFLGGLGPVGRRFGMVRFGHNKILNS